MNRKVSYLRALIGLLVLLMAAPPCVLAQSSGAGAFRQEELDQMLAPIALYPDSLLGQILVAATYPDQVTEADQWVGQNRSLEGDQLNDALDRMNWDLSVKALVPFPQVLAMMSDKREWTQRMGDAFMAQQADVMDTIQRLRAKAHAEGNLNSTEQQKVVVKGESIEIEPANPQVVYVPTYNPVVIYGSWWYPSYPPYAYNPYYPHYAYDPYYTGLGFVTAGLFGFTAGIAVGSAWNWGWGHWDWGHRDVNININRTVNINRHDFRHTDVRTSSWRNVSHHRGSREIDRQHVGKPGVRRSGDRTGVKSGTRPTPASVQQGLKQRGSPTQARQGKSGKQGKDTSMRSGRDRSSTSRSGSSVSRNRSGSSRSGSSVSRDRSGTSRSGSSISRNRSGSSRSGSSVSRDRSGTSRSGSSVSRDRSGTSRSGSSVSRNRSGSSRGGGGGHGGGSHGGGGGGKSHDKHQ